MHPPWLKKRLFWSAESSKTTQILRNLHLNTVCENAHCPNIIECFSNNTATFLILGNTCTRSCKFCAIGTSPDKKTNPVIDNEEPYRIANAVKELNLTHVVITSVTRDDLSDGGAEQFANTIKAIRKITDNIIIEVLTPDFKGIANSVKKVLDANPNVFAHNIETVPRLYNLARSQANYLTSLTLLKIAKKMNTNIYTKSGIMLGLGETKEEVLQVMYNLREIGCDILTLGQYLQPSTLNLKVAEYIKPEIFDEYKTIGISCGFKEIVSGPFVRSSYNLAKMNLFTKKDTGFPTFVRQDA
ncbi:MAG: lipoyl synthase [Candidatus Firestonebacteria bacterium]